MIYNAKSVPVNASLHGLIMLAACIPCFLLVSRVWKISQVSALASYWLEDCANFTTTPEENNANSLLPMNNYTPLVMSRNDKN
jgi:hypothetical protein